MFRHEWVAHCKRPFGGPEYVLRYLGQYTHRVAISNRRLVSLADGKVTFTWRDRAHGNRKRLMTLTAEKFLGRFLLHVLPKRFVRIRNFGFLANRRRGVLLPLCFQLLGSAPQATATSQQPADEHTAAQVWTCPKCGSPMIIVMRLNTADILLRSPPDALAVHTGPLDRETSL